MARPFSKRAPFLASAAILVLAVGLSTGLDSSRDAIPLPLEPFFLSLDVLTGVIEELSPFREGPVPESTSAVSTIAEPLREHLPGLATRTRREENGHRGAHHAADQEG